MLNVSHEKQIQENLLPCDDRVDTSLQTICSIHSATSNAECCNQHSKNADSRHADSFIQISSHKQYNAADPKSSLAETASIENSVSDTCKPLPVDENTCITSHLHVTLPSITLSDLSLDIKSRSIESTLIPLVNQV